MRASKAAGASLRLMRAVGAAVMVAALPVSLTSCALSSTAHGPAATASNASAITLNHINTLKSVFNRDDGHTRLILIFSPT
jgi:hypothetical protein